MGLTDWAAEKAAKGAEKAAKGIKKAAFDMAKDMAKDAVIDKARSHFAKVYSADYVAKRSEAQVKLRIVSASKLWGRKFRVLDESDETVFTVTCTKTKASLYFASGDEVCTVNKRKSLLARRVVAHVQVPGQNAIPVTRSAEGFVLGKGKRRDCSLSTIESWGGTKVMDAAGETIAMLKGTWGDDYVLLTDYADYADCVVDGLVAFATGLVVGSK